MAQINIGGERIDLVKECRLQGLETDHRWTWNKQVEVKKEVRLKRIVILKRLASTKWGNFQETSRSCPYKRENSQSHS